MRDIRAWRRSDDLIRDMIMKLREYVQRTDDRIDELEQQANRVRVVAELPANAPAGMLLVTTGDPNVYVGTGPNTPLRRIPTQPIA